YGATLQENYFLGFTTVESGAGVQTNQSAVMISEDGFTWDTVHKFKKDFWRPMKIFKYGVISVPSGEMNMGNIYLSGEGLIGLDGESRSFSLEKNL
ncbi:MAG: hypothetical protein N2D54_12190, partial [Chloroflexota bacterium]